MTIDRIVIILVDALHHLQEECQPLAEVGRNLRELRNVRIAHEKRQEQVVARRNLALKRNALVCVSENAPTFTMLHHARQQALVVLGDHATEILPISGERLLAQLREKRVDRAVDEVCGRAEEFRRG